MVYVAWVVCEDLCAYAVFEWCDDGAAVGVVFGVGGEDELDIEWYADVEATYLDVSFLEDIEECDLEACLEVGQLVDDEYESVAAGYEPVVDGVLVGE